MVELVGTIESINLVSDAAMFIAAALQQPNQFGKRGSTIKVLQFKQKFNQVVVYCTLADVVEVQEAWKEKGHSGEPSQRFKRECFVRDACTYRNAYMAMRKLTRGKLTDTQLFTRASYPKLLETKVPEEEPTSYEMRLFGVFSKESYLEVLHEIYV